MFPGFSGNGGPFELNFFYGGDIDHGQTGSSYRLSKNWNNVYSKLSSK